MTSARNAPRLIVGDRVIAALVAQCALRTPGVRRLQPGPVRAARQAVSGAVARARPFQRVSSPIGPVAIDPTAVAVQRTELATTATVSVVLTGQRPVLETVRDLHRRLTHELVSIAASDAVVTVLVADLADAGGRDTEATTSGDATGR